MASVWVLCGIVCLFGGGVLAKEVIVTIDNTSKSTSPIRVVVSLLKRFPIQIISFAVTLLSFFSLTSLGAYHCMLISMAETTNERVRRVYEKNGGTSNPNDQVRIFFFFPQEVCVVSMFFFV